MFGMVLFAADIYLQMYPGQNPTTDSATNPRLLSDVVTAHSIEQHLSI
jgi:hypothetical protein